MKKILNKTIKQPQSPNIHFWPAKINNKFNSSCTDAPCFSGGDFDSKMIAYFFGIVDTDGTIKLPELPSILPTPTTSNKNNFRDITISINDFKKVQDIYREFLKDENFDLSKTNYFLSDMNFMKAPEQKGGYTYWFVEDWKTIIDQTTGEIVSMTFDLSFDGGSSFFDVWWQYKGVINLLRQHNRRWVPDNLFGTKKYIPDFQTNRFLQSCGIGCEELTTKVQTSQSMPLISSRYWDAENNIPKNSDWLKWKGTDKNAVVQSNKLLLLLWCVRVDQFEASKSGETAGDGAYSVYQGDITNLENYSLPYKLLVYIPSSDDGLVNQKELNDIIVQIQVKGILSWGKGDKPDETKEAEHQYRIVNASVTDDMWVDGTFKKSKTGSGNEIPNLYEPNLKDDQVMRYYASETNKEYYYFIDEQNFLWPSMFKTPKEIIEVETIDNTNYNVEPHVFTNKHFETTISVFNKNSFSFDISNLLINRISGEYDRPTVTGGDTSYYTFKLLNKKGEIEPSMVDIKYYLLDNDTSVAYKRDNNVLYTQISGSFSWPWYDNSYNEHIRQSQNWREASLANNEASFKAGRYSAEQAQRKAIVGGALGGLLGGAGVGVKGAGAGAIKMGAGGAGLAGAGLGAVVGAGAAWLGSQFDKKARMNELETQRDNAIRSMRAEYEDAKNKPANINGGSPLTTQAEIRFAMQKDDDYDPKNCKWIWTPMITFQQVKDYDCYTIAIDKNRNGYQQNRWVYINNFDDLMIRKYWNSIAIANAVELFSKNSIQWSYIDSFVSQLITSNGIRFWNLDNVKIDDIYNYSKHNYEKEFDTSLMTLQEVVRG